MAWPTLGSRTAKEQNNAAETVGSFVDQAYYCRPIQRCMHVV